MVMPEGSLLWGRGWCIGTCRGFLPDNQTEFLIVYQVTKQSLAELLIANIVVSVSAVVQTHMGTGARSEGVEIVVPPEWCQ